MLRKFILSLSVSMVLALNSLAFAETKASATDPDSPPSASALTSSQATVAKVDINTATAAQLAEVKGLGKTRSEAIVAYREAHGPFNTVADLTQVKGIGPKLLAQIQEKLTVNE